MNRSRSRPMIAAASAAIALAAISAPAPATAAEPAGTVALKFLAEGAMPKLGGYRPQRLALKAERPSSLKRAPDLAAPLFGSFKIGPKESPREILVAVDEPEGKPFALHVDANGNGDLTDDPPAAWDKQGGPGRTMYSGGATVAIKYADAETPAHIAMYRFDKSDPARAPLKMTLLYYADYAYEGTVTLGGVEYKAMLADDLTTGDFRGTDDSDGSNVRLLLDVNASGTFDRRGESFDVRKPFNIKGTTYELTGLTASGAGLKVVKSDKSVDEVLPPPDLGVGKPILKFDAKTLEGKDVSFPSTYAGKLVLLDFWATWCGPCIGELPNLTGAYEKFHDRGFDVLGISLDQANQKAKLESFLKDKKMAWLQVYDGKYWKAEVAEKYGIDSIPRAFLVDGDTGEILATGNSLRGTELSRTVEKALARKKDAGKSK